ncbi:MAG: DivIVA domain-containing protein, partial [Solirubrobacteraceae bacterium]
MPDQSSAANEHAIIEEITGPLASLPDDALALVNADFPTALRGYERVAVDDYVRQARRLVAELQATRSPEAAVRRALERVGEQISGILQRAHETAEQITAQSRVEAEDRLEQARVEAHHVAGAAEQRVRDLDVDTDRIWLERQRIVADAEDLAAQLLALARTAAERFPEDPEADAEARPAGAEPAAPAPLDDADTGDTGDDSAAFAEREGTIPYDEDHAAATEAVEPSFAVDENDDEHSLTGESGVEETVAFHALT